MSAYKQKPASQDITSQPMIYRIRMSPEGITAGQQKKFDEIMNVHKAVVDRLEHESSKKLCKLTDYHEAKIMEAIQFPNMHKEPLLEKTSQFMAESALSNIRVKNSLGASKEVKQSIVNILKDLGVRDEAITQDTLGLVAVKEKDEFKSPESVVYELLYHRYMQHLQTALK